ncbi:hypothetical protein Lalb_Chr03g0034201 [Lupinus albus]|uniref:Uncharacterized protein n=1 Tax=Lupinus albus TaxID=3870 RepID=A0A6A4QUN6_LUPAL|nr:hypothetical protein Lalb_Chr03g0034201 [Lupinus albus]
MLLVVFVPASESPLPPLELVGSRLKKKPSLAEGRRPCGSLGKKTTISPILSFCHFTYFFHIFFIFFFVLMVC